MGSFIVSIVSSPAVRHVLLSAAGYLFTIFLLGGTQRVAAEYHITPVQQILSVADAAVVEQRTLLIAPGATVAVSGTVVNTGQPVSGTIQ